MKKGNIIFKAAIAASIIVATFAVQNVKAEDNRGVTLNPGNGMSFVVGSKRATTYFMPAAGDCEVTIMVSEATPVADQQHLSASRMKIKLTPGNSSRLDSIEGKSLKIVCNANAKSMTISNEVLKVSSLN